jgi:hypothetical protein
MIMQEDSVTWNPTYFQPHIGPLVKLYVWLMLATLVVAFSKLIRLWIAAPPFRLSRVSHPGYLGRLQATRNSLQQWIGCTLLAGCFGFTVEVYNSCNRVLEVKAAGIFVFAGTIRDLSVIPTLALFVAFVLFLIQWHLLNRIERLRPMNAPSGP